MWEVHHIRKPLRTSKETFLKEKWWSRSPTLHNQLYINADASGAATGRELFQMTVWINRSNVELREQNILRWQIHIQNNRIGSPGTVIYYCAKFK